jgi:hypothetical protein
MFTQFNVISPNSFQSFEKLIELNTHTAQAIADQHTELLTTIFDETLAFFLHSGLVNDLPSAISDQNKISSTIYYETLNTWKQTTETLVQGQKEAELLFMSLNVSDSEEEGAKKVEKDITKEADKKMKESAK